MMNNIKMPQTGSIKEALEKMSVNGKQIVLCANDDDEITGTITDGDIRRALLSGSLIDDSVFSICNKQFKFVTEYNVNDIRRLMEANSIRHVPHLNEHNQLIDLYTYENIMGSISDTAIMIFAGGKGERMRPVTLNTPKPLLSVGEKSAIEMIVDRILAQHINAVYISVHYKSNMIMDSLIKNYSDISSDNFIIENEALGTAGSLHIFADGSYANIITHNSDIISDINLRMMLNVHKRDNNDVTVCLIPLTFKLPYGIADIESGDIRKINEKPESTYLVMGGVNIFSKGALDSLHGQTMGMDELIKYNIELERKVGYFIHDGFWVDIGELKQYLSIKKAFRSDK